MHTTLNLLDCNTELYVNVIWELINELRFEMQFFYTREKSNMHHIGKQNIIMYEYLSERYYSLALALAVVRSI